MEDMTKDWNGGDRGMLVNATSELDGEYVTVIGRFAEYCLIVQFDKPRANGYTAICIPAPCVQRLSNQ